MADDVVTGDGTLRAALERLCDDADGGTGIVLFPGLSEYHVVEVGLLRAALAASAPEADLRAAIEALADRLDGEPHGCLSPEQHGYGCHECWRDEIRAILAATDARTEADGLTEDERTDLVLNISFDCPTCGHGYRHHYQQHGGCRECRFPMEDSGTDCIQTMTSALGWALTPAVERILSARTARTARTAHLEAALAAAEAKLGAVGAMADEWLDSTAKGDCPDGYCGDCTLYVAGQRPTAALTTTQPAEGTS